MDSLHQKIKIKLDEWRSNSFHSEEYPAVSEILEYFFDSETSSLSGLLM